MAYRNGPKIVTDGLVLCLDAAGTKSYPGSGTTWYDLSGNGNNGTLVNTPVYISDNGGMFSFGGSNESINVPVSSSLQSEIFTFDIWFKLNSIPAGGISIFSGHYQHYGTISGLTTFAYQGSYWFQTRLNNTCCQSLTVGTASTGVWVNFSGTRSSSLKIAYLNGIQAGTQSTTGTHSQLNNFSIGNNADNIANNNYNGSIDGYIPMIKYYNRVLTSDEILQNYKATKGRFGL